ncbi:uncharacterized protein LOC122509868 [Leptopilina heterotoma]|uniref:uncharacterized protein LOC122509868 n=1 Tax=Leptopilina heterotoma TaxID=63436 RepID=UPI001CA85F15|nr:uncharacterized protein LOC122509868 [Leptopilina heterotoma]
MLKIIYLSFIVFLTTTEGVELKATRIYLYINPNKTENNFFQSPFNVTLGSEDVNVEWIREVNVNGSNRDFTLRLYIDYIGKYPGVDAPTRTCVKPSGTSYGHLTQTLFQLMLTGDKIPERCPVGKQSPTRSPGKIESNVPKAHGIHCNTHALIKLTITNHFQIWRPNYHSWREYKILRIIYSGQFLNC